MADRLRIAFHLNGIQTTREVFARVHLADFLRQEMGLTGTHLGCEHGACGACSVRLDGAVVRGCLILAVQVDGRSVDTIEGLSDAGELASLQGAFHRRNALQCGFCTPGMLLTAAELIERERRPDRRQIREYLSGNLCRCTGYHAIVDAVDEVCRDRDAGGAVC